MNTVPLGIGNPDDPLYGVFDTEQNFFYLISWHRHIVERATALVAPYRSVRLETISDAVNYQHNLLDNLVCMNWGLEYTPEKFCVSRNIDHDATTNQLIKNLLVVLSVGEQAYNFRQTIDLFCRRRIGTELPAETLRQQFVNDAWFNIATQKETENFNRVRNDIEQNIKDIESVFDLDIGLPDYTQQISANIAKLPIDTKFKRIFYEF